MRQFFLAPMLLLISGTAYAAAPGAAPPVAHEPAPPASAGAGLQAGDATRIETDQETGTVRIIVNNREVARFDTKGLHVRDEIEHGGQDKDIGQAGYDKLTAPEPKH